MAIVASFHDLVSGGADHEFRSQNAANATRKAVYGKVDLERIFAAAVSLGMSETPGPREMDVHDRPDLYAVGADSDALGQGRV
ncbi:hypothetical protein [Spirillospora sp. NPDC029432]|uniref:hypothetical protein n=1 Tax=Spirillospora sp. NPDC029432 TaxID=3154599 RepID=UPI0034512E3C